MKADMVKKLAIMLMSQNKEMNMNDALSVVFNSALIPQHYYKYNFLST